VILLVEFKVLPSQSATEAQVQQSSDSMPVDEGGGVYLSATSAASALWLLPVRSFMLFVDMVVCGTGFRAVAHILKSGSRRRVLRKTTLRGKSELGRLPRQHGTG
jgi:hypothetical protein